MKKLLSLALVVLLCASMMLAAGCTEKAYPNKPITLSVSSAAGGGTDLGCRTLAAGMEEVLGVKVNVVNVEAGGGGAAADAVYSADHDGYSILGIFEGHFANACTERHATTIDDWTYNIIGGTPGVLSVSADSPYNSVQDVIDDMLARPGEVTLANSSVGCIWDVKAGLLQSLTGIEYTFVPYNGSNPSILACLNSEVDVIITGVGEQAEFLEAGKLKPLAMIETYSFVVPGGTEVPSICDTVPEMAAVLPVNQTIGICVPSDVPDDVKAKIEEAFIASCASDTMKEYAASKQIDVIAATGDDARAIAETMASTISWMLWDKGVATVNPSEFNIPQPK